MTDDQSKEELLMYIGLTKNEAKVYLTLLDIGSATAHELSTKAGLHRTNIYDAIERLIEKGVASYIVKNKTKYYSATDPNNLLNILKEKELRLLSVLPSLILTKRLSKTKSTTEIYEGMAAFRTVMFDLLKYKKTIYAVGIPKIVPSLVKNWIMSFHNERARQKINFIHIYNSGAIERIKFLRKLPYTKARSLPPKYDSPVSLFSCGDETLIVMWDIQPLTFVRIYHPKFAEAVMKWFNLMWNLAK